MTALDRTSRDGATKAAPHVTDWTAAHLAGLDRATMPQVPVIGPADVRRVSDDLDVWDAWPLQLVDGRTALFDGRAVWMALSAPVMGDPALRHSHARIRLLTKTAGGWRDHGPAMPDGFSPGLAEWSGAAVYDPGTAKVELHFTASGRRGEAFRTEQRLFRATADFAMIDGAPRLTGWSAPVESLNPQAKWRRPALGLGETDGFIAAFRDPAPVRDPATGEDYLVYAATLADAGPLFNGAIGLARRWPDGGYQDLGPLIRAPGLNHELERPHVLHRNGWFYLLWCTQGKMFAPGGPSGPTGLYGMASRSLLGPYTPLNGTGLVAANPTSEPLQTYAWWVTGEGACVGFIDLWGANGQSAEALGAKARAHFGGAMAPAFQVTFNGTATEIS
jgi:levansucrase